MMGWGEMNRQMNELCCYVVLSLLLLHTAYLCQWQRLRVASALEIHILCSALKMLIVLASPKFQVESLIIHIKSIFTDAAN